MLSARLTTDKCRHSQNDGSTVYYLLEITHEGAGGMPLQLRLTEAAYVRLGGNNSVSALLDDVVWKINNKNNY